MSVLLTPVKTYYVLKIKEENKKSKIYFFGNCSTFIFDQKLCITLAFQINFLHKLYSHVRYEKAYHYKKFQNFNIKILTIIAYPNFKFGFGHLGFKSIVNMHCEYFI